MRMSLCARRGATSESVKAIEENVQMVGGRVLIAGGGRLMVGGSLLIASGSVDAPPVCTQNRVACAKSSSAHALQRPVGMENCRGGALIAGGSALIVGGDYLSVPIYKLTSRSNAVIATSARPVGANAGLYGAASKRQPSRGGIGAVIRPRIEGDRRARGSVTNGVDDHFE